MQRINLWPNPDFVPSGFHTSGSGKDLAEYMSAGRFANTSPDYIDLPFASCELGAEYVCCFNISATVAVNNIAIWSGSGSWKPQAQTVGMQTIRFVPAAADTRLGVPPGMTIDSLIVELADTYDTAIGGGASSLLLRRHDAARIGVSVGRVMSDDGHEPDKQSKRPRHAEAGRVHADYDHREDSGYPILVHGLAGRVGRLRHDRQLSGHLQQEPTHRMVLHVPAHESDEPEIQGRVRQSDRQGVEHGHVRAGRIPGEQGPARRHRIFRRGYDAARLTHLGVMA